MLIIGSCIYIYHIILPADASMWGKERCCAFGENVLDMGVQNITKVA